ncbi:hypothetical protein H5410_004485 [Solanum commersonii]|uniref:Uncharacterized protein n=1 Tax=Solanum commersonii TaxID=4109 RepID=A0A9J6B7T7_SOLCO|nr:hypothetical protein H5410_004485 [Solanum commersonii]
MNDTEVDFTRSKVRALMTTNTETVANPVDTLVDSTTRESAIVEENRTLRHANERCEYHLGSPGHSTDNYWNLKGTIKKLINHGIVVVTDDQNTPNVTNNPLPAQNYLVGMICDDQEYKLLGKIGKFFRKIGEEKSLKNSEPAACLSVESINLDTKVLCVPGVSKRLELRSGTPRLYLPITNPKVVPWNYNKIVVFYQGKEIVQEVDETRGITCFGRYYSPEELREGKMAPRYPSTTEEGCY